MGSSAQVFGRVDHIGIIVADLDKAAQLFVAMGLRLSQEVRIEGRLRANFYICGNVELELIDISEPAERARRLGTTTATIEHVAIEVPELNEALKALSALGVEGATAPKKIDSGYSVMTKPETTAGIVLQLLQKH